MGSFDDFQYCIYADFAFIVSGWVRKVQNHADVIYEWSLRVFTSIFRPKYLVTKYFEFFYNGHL